MEDRLIELEALQKALLEGTGLFVSINLGAAELQIFPCFHAQLLLFSVTEAYDNMQADLITARKSLTKILTSKDVKATVCLTVFAYLVSKIDTVWLGAYQLNWILCRHAVTGIGWTEQD